MTQKGQLALPLAYRPAQGSRDFLVSGSNRAAFLAVSDRGDGLGRRFALSGPEGAGKTHLASIWGERTGAVSQSLGDLTEPRLDDLQSSSAIVLEDADRVAAMPGPVRRQVEVLLFHLLNVCAAQYIPLMLTGRTPPARWPVETPDLVSRLAALPHVAIQPPDDELLTAILGKLFRDRQLSVRGGVLEFLVRRMDRSFAAAQHIVAELDRMSLEQGRTISRPFAAQLFPASTTEEDELGER